jgi:hypothetical protein
LSDSEGIFVKSTMAVHLSRVDEGVAEHSEFQELCALFCAGTLNEEEHARLHEHLSYCLDCQSFLERFPKKAAAMMSALASEHDLELSPDTSLDTEAAKNRLFERISRHEDEEDVPNGGRLEFAVAAVPGHAVTRQICSQPRRAVRSFKVYLLFAAACFLLTFLTLRSLAPYRNGPREEADEMRADADRAESEAAASRLQIMELSKERDGLKLQLQNRADKEFALRKQVAQLERRADELEAFQSTSENERQELRTDKENLSKDLESAKLAATDLRKELDSSRGRYSNESLKLTDLEKRVQQLSASAADQKDKIEVQQAKLSEQSELLAHDRDIRNLMGARELYVAEVYDSDENGRTKKPYARVFYTKDKSLIFYGFDLDRQPGLKNASTFQVWGRRGPNRENALNLGILFQDSATNKRWIMKMDDPIKLEQIDAVFVTIEPKGGSLQPTGKHLLFAYLRVDPNHP